MSKDDAGTKDAILRVLDSIDEGDCIFASQLSYWRKRSAAAREQWGKMRSDLKSFAEQGLKDIGTIAALQQRVEELEGWYNANESRLQKFEKLTKIHGLTDPVDELANAFQKHIDEIRRVFELWKGAKEQLDWFLSMKEGRIKELEAKTTPDVTVTEDGKASTEAVED